MASVLGEVDLVVKASGEVVLKFQTLSSLVKVGKHKLVRRLQAGTLLDFVAMIVLGQHHAKLAGCLLVVVVSLAEALDKLRVSQGACKTCLALTLLQLVEKIVAIGVGSHLVEIVEQEVASVDDIIKVGIYSLNIGIGGLDVLPTIDVACLLYTSDAADE